MTEQAASTLDLAPVNLGEVRVQPHRRWRVGSKLLLQGCLARLQVLQLLLQAGGAVPLDQGLDQLVELARGLGQFALLPSPGGGRLAPVSVDLLVVRRDELLDHLRRHQALAQPLHDQLLEAMHAGVPLLVTPIAGMKDLVARGAAIEIPFEGAGIAEVVRDHWDTALVRAKAQAIAEVARQLVRTEYGSERMAREYAALYRRVLAAARPG